MAPTALAAEGSSFRPAVRSARGVVVSETAQASQAGIAVLREGGNAMDAAVTSVFALAVTLPGQCGIGGGVRILYRSANGATSVIDGGAKAPAATTPTTIGSAPGGIDTASGGYGHRVVAVPGAVAGLGRALESAGTIKLPRATAPAELLARDGFAVGPGLAQQIAYTAEKLAKFPAAARIFLRPDGSPRPEGSLLVQGDLADTLKAIADDGPSAFYEGSVADELAAEFAKPPAYPGDESILTAADLANYEPAERQAIAGTYRGANVVTVPPPMSGAAVLETLNIVGGFPLAQFGQSSADSFHVRAEAQKIAEVDSDSVVTDPAFANVPTSTLISPAYANQRRSQISMANAGVYTSGIVPAAGHRSASHTTSVSAIDVEGNAAVITCTNSSWFGSAVVAAGTGVLLNNSMTVFFPAGHPDQAEPNKFTATAIAPTIVVSGGRPLLALGAGGSSAIYRSIPEVISNVLDFGLDLAHAVDAERFHGYQDDKGPYAYAEDARIDSKVMATLKQRGHKLVKLLAPNRPRQLEYACCTDMGFLHAAGIDPLTGERLGVADPRAPGALALGQ